MGSEMGRNWPWDTWEMGPSNVESSCQHCRLIHLRRLWGGHSYGMPKEVEIFRMNLHQSHDEYNIYIYIYIRFVYLRLYVCKSNVRAILSKYVFISIKYNR